MPKLKAPLLSFGAVGRLAKHFSLTRRRKQNILEKKPIPTDAKSSTQLFYRHMFSKCIDLWHLLSDAEKQEWESAARPKHMTGYAWYISQCLRPNPGIYLPLQGGTMSGNIDMDKNRILKLPEPVDGQEAARLVDLPAAYTHPDNIQCTLVEGDIPAAIARDAEVTQAIADHAGLPNVHHIPPDPGSKLFVAETEVFNGTSPIVWTDLDLGYTVGITYALVLLKIVGPTVTGAIAFRKNGDTDEFYDPTGDINASGCVLFKARNHVHHVVIVAADILGKIEWITEVAQTLTVDIIAYIR